MLINLDRHSIDIACPRCKFFNTVTLKQVRIRDAVICRGCKVTIRFEDHMNETRKAIRSINRAMQELEDTLKGMGKVKIRL